jgi:phospholipid/cholesterol/gamma-HCH transport system ATP-binding protein
MGTRHTPPPAGSPNGDLDDVAPIEIVTDKLSKSFGIKRVLREISITVRRGDMIAVVGTSGGGKTVLLDHLTGLMRPDSGRVMVADHSRAACPLVDLTQADPDTIDQVRLHWAIVFQRNALFSGSVYENIALWFREHSSLTESQIKQRARASLKAASLDVEDVINKDRDALSGGMAKRVAIARAIAIEPAVIFYDEPTTGLDPVVSAHIHDLIWNTHHTPRSDGTKRTSIIVTHDKDLLRRISPRIVMLDKGQVVFDGDYEHFRVTDVPAAKQYLVEMPQLQSRPAL